MAAIDLYAINTAEWTNDYSMIMQLTRPGEKYDVKVPVFLIDHPEGVALLDTGVSYEMKQNPENYGPNGAPHMADLVDDIHMEEGQGAYEQIRDLGYEPEDINYVIQSHLHCDHAGDLSKFSESEILIQQDELEYAWGPASPTQEAFYVEGDFSVLRSSEFDVTALNGKYDVFGDGSVVTIPTPGHTKGHQSVKLELENAGTVILGVDIAHLWMGYETETLQSFNWNNRESIRSLRKVKSMARSENATVWVDHDRERFDEFPDPPETLN